MQALNSLISAAEDWKSRYVLTASQTGPVLFSRIIQQDQVLTGNQEVFNIEPGNEGFIGEMSIAQANLGEVKEGQKVLSKLHSFPFEEYGMLSGTIQYISHVPYKDSIFISQGNFKMSSGSDLRRPIHLKQGCRLMPIILPGAQPCYSVCAGVL